MRLKGGQKEVRWVGGGVVQIQRHMATRARGQEAIRSNEIAVEEGGEG